MASQLGIHPLERRSAGDLLTRAESNEHKYRNLIS